VRRLIGTGCARVALLFLGSGAALAQTAAPLTQGEDALAFPSVARVLFAFLFTVALAVGVAWALKRWLPKFRTSLLGGEPRGQRMQVIERIQLSVNTRVHLVRIDENTLVVAENRHGISMTVLPAAATNEKIAGKE
jgi:flagellar biogenesis protein FliO